MIFIPRVLGEQQRVDRWDDWRLKCCRKKKEKSRKGTLFVYSLNNGGDDIRQGSPIRETFALFLPQKFWNYKLNFCWEGGEANPVRKARKTHTLLRFPKFCHVITIVVRLKIYGNFMDIGPIWALRGGVIQTAFQTIATGQWKIKIHLQEITGRRGTSNSWPMWPLSLSAVSTGIIVAFEFR